VFVGLISPCVPETILEVLDCPFGGALVFFRKSSHSKEALSLIIHYFSCPKVLHVIARRGNEVCQSRIGAYQWLSLTISRPSLDVVLAVAEVGGEFQ